MSQSMNTTAGPIGEVAPPSNNRWWHIAAGIGLAAVLGYGAALVATDHLPGTTHTAAAPVAAVATPQVESIAGSDDLATRSATGSSGAVTHSALDPFEERSGAVSSAVGTSGAVAQSYAGADDLATRSSAVGASGIVEQSILDALEERSGAVSSVTATGMAGASREEITGSLSDPAAGYFDGQWHNVEAPNKYPAPEFR